MLEGAMTNKDNWRATFIERSAQVERLHFIAQLYGLRCRSKYRIEVQVCGEEDSLVTYRKFEI